MSFSLKKKSFGPFHFRETGNSRDKNFYIVVFLQREFELEDVLDYVKTGIASIIEDEVTQRFDSEELKVVGRCVFPQNRPY